MWWNKCKLFEYYKPQETISFKDFIEDNYSDVADFVDEMDFMFNFDNINDFIPNSIISFKDLFTSAFKSEYLTHKLNIADTDLWWELFKDDIKSTLPFVKNKLMAYCSNYTYADLIKGRKESETITEHNGRNYSREQYTSESSTRNSERDVKDYDLPNVNNGTQENPYGTPTRITEDDLSDTYGNNGSNAITDKDSENKSKTITRFDGAPVEVIDQYIKMIKNIVKEYVMQFKRHFILTYL